MELLFTGRWMDATEALGWSLVNEVLPSNQLEERVWQMARGLTAQRAAISTIKRITRFSEGLTVSAAMAERSAML